MNEGQHPFEQILVSILLVLLAEVAHFSTTVTKFAAEFYILHDLEGSYRETITVPENDLRFS